MDRTDRAQLALLILTLALAALVWATSAFGLLDEVGPDPAGASDLESFSDCDELRDYARDHRWALEPIGYPAAIEDGVAIEEGAMLRATSTEAASPDSVGTSETGTNVQEAGIDEPDIAKLDGETLYVIERGALRSFDVGGDVPVPLDEVDLSGRAAGTQLLIGSGRALVIEDSWSRRGDAATELTEIDIVDPAAMAPIRRLELDGGQVSARLRGETAHLVLSSDPIRLDGDDVATRLPKATLTDLITGESTTQPIVGCDAISYPDRFSGLGLLSVLTFDLSQGLLPTDVEAVITDGTTVYASAASLYVATETVTEPPQPSVMERLGVDVAPVPPALPSETTIHRFDTGADDETIYASSGRVEGRILNEWSLSEHEGNLRVATTTGDSWIDGAGESESGITVLAEDDGELETVGEVWGLGPGEEIFGVRFVEEMGYVVTFEQTDPLYAVDLSDPAAPEVTGELKIPGYSAYLHPVGEGRLLGIGQAGTMTGTLTGAQASLFDVADAADPERLATLALSRDGYGSASAEWDHHAFTFSPERSLAVVPVESYSGASGAVVMRVDPDGALEEIDRIEGRVERSFLVGDRLVTVSGGDVASHELSVPG